MSEWITDRRPTENDADVHNNVYNRYGVYTHWVDIDFGEPWMPITPPEPYAKPKKYKARYSTSICTWVIDGRNGLAAVLDELSRNDDEHREAAERIAAICEEVMP